MKELTTVRARESVCTYGIPVAIGLRSPADDAVLLRYSEEDAWLVGVGKRAPHGFRCPYYLSVGSLARRKAYTLLL